MWLPGIRRLHEGLRDCLDEAGLLDDLIEMLNHANGMLIIAESWRGGLHLVLMRTLILESLERVEEFVKTYAQYVGELTMMTLCDEFEGLPEGVEWGCLWKR